MEQSRPFGACRHPKAWTIARVAVLAAAASLACYIPYKYATHPPSMSGAYGFLFPLSTLIALAGIVLALRPGLAFRMPIASRVALAGLGAAWATTGLLCLSSLAATTAKMPLPGLFATFHMLVQHVFLTFAVGGFVLVPRAIYRLFGFELAQSPSEANLRSIATET